MGRKESVTVECEVTIHRAAGFDDKTWVRLNFASFQVTRETDDNGQPTGIETWEFKGLADR